MAKVGRKVLSGKCRCGTRNQMVTFWSRRHRDKKGEYQKCSECARRHYTQRIIMKAINENPV